MPAAKQKKKEGKWWLIAQLPPLKPGSALGLEFLRELEDSEAEEVRAANSLLAGLASAAAYARLVELYKQLDSARRKTTSAKRMATDMNRIARALGRADGCGSRAIR